MKLLLGLIAGICFVGICIHVSVWRRRASRFLDLKHHIDMIMDPAGCITAISEHLPKARHIMHRYGIPLTEAYPKTGLVTEEDLVREATLSFRRAKVRERQAKRLVRNHFRSLFEEMKPSNP